MPEEFELLGVEGGGLAEMDLGHIGYVPRRYPATIALLQRGDHLPFTWGIRDVGDGKHRDGGASKLQWAGSCQDATQELKLKFHEKKKLWAPPGSWDWRIVSHGDGVGGSSSYLVDP